MSAADRSRILSEVFQPRPRISSGDAPYIVYLTDANWAAHIANKSCEDWAGIVAFLEMCERENTPQGWEGHHYIDTVADSTRPTGVFYFCSGNLGVPFFKPSPGKKSRKR